MKRATTLGVLILLVTVIAGPAVADTNVPNEGNSGIKIVEAADGDGEHECLGSGVEITWIRSGYYMSRWDTLTGEVFAVENVHIDWVFTNSDGDTWTYRERGASVVREGDGIFYVSNNGQHHHWKFGAHIGHRVFTAEDGGATHLEELIEAGQAFDNAVIEACKRLSG
jgi:hypothetical protein